MVFCTPSYDWTKNSLQKNTFVICIAYLSPTSKNVFQSFRYTLYTKIALIKENLGPFFTTNFFQQLAEVKKS